MARGEEAEATARRVAEEILGEVLKVLPRIRCLPRPEHRFLALLAIINAALEQHGLGRLVLVGGFAVEVLTGGVLRTLDVDVVVEGRAAQRVVEELLSMLKERLGLEESSRGPVVGLGGAEKAIDLLPPRSGWAFPLLVLEVPGYGWVYVESPEDLVLRYLRERAYWSTGEAWRRVLFLLAVLGDRMKLGELRRKAQEEDPRLSELLSDALRILRERGLLDPDELYEEVR